MAEWLRDLRRCAPSREFESGRVQIFFRFSETVLTNWLISLKCLQIVLHENKAYCALPHAYRRPLRRPSPASLSSCAEYARRLLRIQFVVRESRCAGPEPDTWELQKLLLQRTNSPNIIWLQFHNFKTSKNK
jgi:hypothetical protein